MFDLSPIKLLIIVVVALVVLGPDKLPEFARQAGRLWQGLRVWRDRVESEVREVVPDLPSSAEVARLVRSPVNLLNTLADRVSNIDEDETTTESPDEDIESDNDETPEDDDTDATSIETIQPYRAHRARKDAPPAPADPSLN